MFQCVGGLLARGSSVGGVVDLFGFEKCAGAAPSGWLYLAVFLISRYALIALNVSDLCHFAASHTAVEPK